MLHGVNTHLDMVSTLICKDTQHPFARFHASERHSMNESERKGMGDADKDEEEEEEAGWVECSRCANPPRDPKSSLNLHYTFTTPSLQPH
jgi:hypothetical protein